MNATLLPFIGSHSPNSVAGLLGSAEAISPSDGMRMQGTATWFQARCGKVTASRVADVVARTKTGWGAARTGYMAELVAERLTGQVADSFTSPAMRWGQEWEAEARRAYEFHSDRDVEETGFVPHPLIEMSGASPDGLVGAEGLVEIKAPTTATHIEILTSREVPARYVTQMMWQMACTERAWCDFVSYDPRLPEHLRLFIARVPRDEVMIDDLEVAVSRFLEELDARVMSLDLRYAPPKANDHDVRARNAP